MFYVCISTGHFALFLASDSDKEEVAQLESEFMMPVDRACLEMWHYIQTWLSNSEFIHGFC